MFFENGSNICMSGGADGSDLQFGMCAGKLGHQVIHWSFAGHKTAAPAAELVRLTDAQLREADPHLLRANKTLKRHLSFERSWINLLRRNFYQVRWSEHIYGVSTLAEKGIDGGTAWAFQMALDANGDHPHLYLFDQAANKWLTWRSRTWVEIADEDVPAPHGIYAGIGKRKLLDNGKRAIRKLMQYDALAA